MGLGQQKTSITRFWPTLVAVRNAFTVPVIWDRHYLHSGMVFSIAFFALLLQTEGSACALDISGDNMLKWNRTDKKAWIKGAFGDSNIIVGVSSRVAGAVDSLVWRGKQYVNSYDHGREFQSAASFDGFGECFNPTEAGSQIDGLGQRSSSKLISLQVHNNTLSTTSEMAFWLAPNDTSPRCSKGPGSYRDQRAGYRLRKDIKIGVYGIPNVLQFDITYEVPNNHSSATFEVLTGYMPPDFSSFLTFSPKDQTFAALTSDPGEQRLPIVVSTPDGSFALGIYDPDLPQEDYPSAGYGRFRFDKLLGDGNPTIKWNCVHRRKHLVAGEFSFRSFIIIGSLSDVQAGMVALRTEILRVRPSIEAK